MLTSHSFKQQTAFMQVIIPLNVPGNITPGSAATMSYATSQLLRDGDLISHSLTTKGSRSDVYGNLLGVSRLEATREDKMRIERLEAKVTELDSKLDNTEAKLAGTEASLVGTQARLAETEKKHDEGKEEWDKNHDEDKRRIRRTGGTNERFVLPEAHFTEAQGVCAACQFLDLP